MQENALTIIVATGFINAPVRYTASYAMCSTPNIYYVNKHIYESLPQQSVCLGDDAAIGRNTGVLIWTMLPTKALENGVHCIRTE